MYIDGHERSDVVQYRNVFLRKMEILQGAHVPPPQCSNEQLADKTSSSTQKHLVIIYHDESIFHSNEDQGWAWVEEGMQTIRPKGQGKGIMVSDFINEYNGYLQLTTEEFESARQHNPAIKKEARVLWKYGVADEGYWDNDNFIKQVKVAAQIAEVKFPAVSHNLLFIFDQSSGHAAFPADALNVNRMNVKPGGQQPAMHDTVWNGKVQKMVFSDGTPKGMKVVLRERGVDVHRLTAAQMKDILAKMEDFKNEKTLVERVLKARGHRCIFLPKYHCELNPIERVWGQAKKYTREHCDYTSAGLQGTIVPALESVDIDLIRKYFRKARDYMRAYREGNTPGNGLEKKVKLYKSHRRVSQTEH